MSNRFEVTSSSTVLDFICDRIGDVKRSTVRQWLQRGLVSVNGNPVVRAGLVLQVGDKVEVRPTKSREPGPTLFNGLPIIFEDRSIIVVDKPAGLLSMASDSEREKTAYAILTDYVRNSSRGGRERVWIVHRLDRETSGLMVFARTDVAKQYLQSQWSRAVKRYLAIVEGNTLVGTGELRSHLDESQPHRVFSARPSDLTRLAVTTYRVLGMSHKCSLLELQLNTGRRHQIRVQLAECKCPVVGDDKYGARTDPARRLALHASHLEIPHPETGTMVSFDSPLPPVLQRLVPSSFTVPEV